MYTLLPSKQRNTLRTEYIVRFVSVALILTGSVFLIGGILLFPSYILSKVAESSVQINENNQNTVTLTSQRNTLGKVVQSVLKESAILSAPDHNPTLVVDEVQKYNSQAITINEFDYMAGATNSTLLVSGTAATRKDFISFSTALQKDPFFNSVNFPISTLAADTNVSFTITLFGKF